MAEEPMTPQSPERLQGWRFSLFNLMLGLGHAVVLLKAWAYTAPVAPYGGDLEGDLAPKL